MVFLTKDSQYFLCPTSLLPHDGSPLSSLKHECEPATPTKWGMGEYKNQCSGLRMIILVTRPTLIKSLIGSVYCIKFEYT